MRFKDYLKLGAVGILGAFGCGGDNQAPRDNGSIVQSPNSALQVPQLSDLEKKVAKFSSETGNKAGLLATAQYGDRFHTYFSLFIANSTRGASHDFGYAFSDHTPVARGIVEKLNYSTSFIGNDRTKDLYEVMKKAETEKHLDEAAYVIGYLDRASVRTEQVFSAFKFFYENGSNTESPRQILSPYIERVAEVREMTGRARTAFDSLSKEVKSELTMWLGTYGHASLQKALPDVPEAPLLEKDAFYKRFGEDLLRGYGLIKQV